MTYLFSLIFGFVEFEFSGGFREDFINDCFKNSIDIKSIELTENGFTAVCSIKTYKTLHKTAYAHGGVVRIIKKRGLPFVLRPLKNRIGFFAGLVACALIISFLEGFIWNIELVGNERISDTTILSFLENSRLTAGVMWSSIDRDDLCWEMMSEFDDIAWVHINKIGTTARVEINETVQKDVPQNDDKLKGITVMRRELEAVAYREQNSLNIKSIKSYKTLKFFSLDIPLYLKKQEGDISEKSVKLLNIKGVDLPIGYTQEEEKILESKPVMLGDEELTALAEKKLEALEEKEFDGFEIINSYKSHKIDNDKCVITGCYIIKEK
ncbi:MAG: sporulation protein YqfD [Eubacterium sp.]